MKQTSVGQISFFALRLSPPLKDRVKSVVNNTGDMSEDVAVI